MARFRAEDAGRYGGQGGGGFFSIANDGEVKQVRLMYNSIDDIDGMSVHKVKVGDKERYVNCLREYNDPVDVCPFCKAGMKTQARLIMPVYNIEEDVAQLWDRGKSMFQKVTGLCNRYTKNGNLVNNVFEIERHGKPNDKKTDYEFFQIDCDDTELDDLPEAPKILGGLVLDKTADEMEYYLEEGQFPSVETNNEDEEEQPRRRESRNSERSSSRESRRTPASSSRRKEDTF